MSSLSSSRLSTVAAAASFPLSYAGKQLDAVTAKASVASHGFLTEKAVEKLEDTVAHSDYGSLKRVAVSFVTATGEQPFLRQKPEVALKLLHVVVIAWKKGEKEKAERDAEKAALDALKKAQPTVIKGNPEKPKAEKESKPASSSSSSASAAVIDKDRERIEKSTVVKLVQQFQHHKVFADKTLVEGVTLECRDGDVHCSEDLLAVLHGPLMAKMTDSKCIDLKKYSRKVIEAFKDYIYFDIFHSFQKMEKLEVLQQLVEFAQFHKEELRQDAFKGMPKGHFSAAIKKVEYSNEADLEKLIQLIQDLIKIDKDFFPCLTDLVERVFGLKMDRLDGSILDGSILAIRAPHIQYLDPGALDEFNEDALVPVAAPLSASVSSSSSSSAVATTEPSKKATLISKALRDATPDLVLCKDDVEHLFQIAECLDESVGQSIRGIVFTGPHEQSQTMEMMDLAIQACPNMKSVHIPFLGGHIVDQLVDKKSYAIVEADTFITLLKKLKPLKSLEKCTFSPRNIGQPLALVLTEPLLAALDGVQASLLDEQESVPELNFGNDVAFYIEREGNAWFQTKFSGPLGVDRLKEELSQRKMLQNYTLKKVVHVEAAVQPRVDDTFILFERRV